MDVTRMLRRYAAPRPFVVPAADGTGARLAVEADMRARGWRRAASPGETGLLVVCGNPGPELERAIGTVWRSMPAPRRRVSSLDEVTGDAGPAEPPDLGEVGMADRGDDRDGLRLDVLHVPLGPVLPDWPAGVRLDVALQGDVVQEAHVTVLESAPGYWRDGRARRLDAVARLLRVAGWDAAAERAAVLRDAAPAEEDAAFCRRVARSRTLRWMTRGVGVRDGRDVHDRLSGWLDEIAGGEGAADGEPVEVLPELVAGEELGRARLIVASVDVDG
ncbi:hypothetical protein [Actinomadura sp. WMMB 499]|uniref:hypothetical protein n=1 Tax=Actinomadura sp. WMMB 499 TaxID=1219491 RepID=UPI00124628A8|nr:hypothetical protein [Actinomadura sp. WMMB 499]QFG25342.1 hypothetical protein F7P10_33520 [Actinomadura sp. WMMB 499]